MSVKLDKVPADNGMLSCMPVLFAKTLQAPIDTIRHEVNKNQVLAQINEVLKQITDAETICFAVKNEMIEDFKAVNCKYSQQQIEEEILPQIDVLISNFTGNILAMKEYLELNSVKKEHARLVLK